MTEANGMRMARTIALTCAGLLGLWILFAPLDNVVRGGGRIIPQARTQLVQHLEGGIVSEILVREGSMVKAGDVLYRLQDQNARTARNEQAIGQQALLLKKQRLEAEQAGLDVLVFDVSGTLDTGQAETEMALFHSRRADIATQKQIIQQQQEQKRLQLADIENQMEQLKAELATSEKQLSINTQLREGGALSESRLLDTQAQVQNLKTRMSGLQGQLPVLRSALGELSQRGKQVQQEYASKVADELSSVNVQMQQFGEREKSLGDRLTRTSVLAPVAGIVNRLTVNTVGGVVQPGAVLAELTPVDGPLVLEGKIGARDRARLWMGQTVQVRVSAYDYADYGSLSGTVRDVSSDSLRDEAANGQTYYRVLIDLGTTSMKPGKPLMPGMTADFYVRGERRTLGQALWKPIKQLFM